MNEKEERSSFERLIEVLIDSSSVIAITEVSHSWDEVAVLGHLVIHGCGDQFHLKVRNSFLNLN